MIAAIELRDQLHPVKWTGRVRLHAGVVTYCNVQADAAQGVLQIPDAVITQGVAYNLDGRKLKPCPQCRVAIQASIG